MSKEPHYLEPELDHEVYHRVTKPRHYNNSVTPLTVVSDRDAAKLLRRFHPAWSKQVHETFAQQHWQAHLRQEATWGQVAEAAAQETLHRSFNPIYDYRISAIGCDSFTEEKKKALRFAARAASNHSRLAHAHWLAAGHRTPYSQVVAFQR